MREWMRERIALRPRPPVRQAIAYPRSEFDIKHKLRQSEAQGGFLDALSMVWA